MNFNDEARLQKAVRGYHRAKDKLNKLVAELLPIDTETKLGRVAGHCVGVDRISVERSGKLVQVVSIERLIDGQG